MTTTTTRRWVGALTVLLAVLAGMLAVPASATAARPADASWRVAATLSLGTGNTAVTCSSARTCWAVEAGQLVSSADGGTTWTTRTPRLPAAVDTLVDIACPTAAKCYATATNADGTQALLTFSDTARSIGSLPVPATAPLTELTCSGPLHCMASDGEKAYVTLDGGATWVQHPLQSTLRGGFGLTCRTGTTTCFAVGEYFSSGVAFRTDDDGATWVYQPVPTDLAALYDVTCPSASTCYAVGALFPSGHSAIIRTTDGGSSWSLGSLPLGFQGPSLKAVSCLTTTSCVASGELPLVLRTTDGLSWGTTSLGAGVPSRPTEVTCPGLTHCLAVMGGAAFVSDDSGATWASVDLVAGLEAPSSLSCPAGTTGCIGVASDALGRAVSMTSPDNGTTWVSHAFPAGAGSPTEVTCPSATTCYAVARYDVPGSRRVVSQAYRSTNGGVTWKAGKVTAAGGAFTEVSCPSTTTCLALGWDSRGSIKLNRTTDGGRTWPVVPAPPTTDHDAVGFSCRASTGCVLVTNTTFGPATAWVTPDLGATWSSDPLPTGEYFDLDCSGTTCLAVGEGATQNQRVARSSDGGLSWATTDLANGTFTAFEVACGSTTSCVMSGDDTVAGLGTAVRTTTDGGVTWAAHALPARNEVPFALACRSSTCWAADYTANGRPQVYTNAP